MRNPWLAIDATTEPAQRARELRHAWERFIGGDRVDSVRTPIVDSWRRSLGAGVDPSRDGSAPMVADDDEAAARWEVHPLVSSAPLIREFQPGGREVAPAACPSGTGDEVAAPRWRSDVPGEKNA